MINTTIPHWRTVVDRQEVDVKFSIGLFHGQKLLVDGAVVELAQDPPWQKTSQYFLERRFPFALGKHACVVVEHGWATLNRTIDGDPRAAWFVLEIDGSPVEWKPLPNHAWF